MASYPLQCKTFLGTVAPVKAASRLCLAADVKMKVLRGARGIASLGFLHKGGGLAKTHLHGRQASVARTSRFQPLLQAVVDGESAAMFERLLAAAENLLPGLLASTVQLHKDFVPGLEASTTQTSATRSNMRRLHTYDEQSPASLEKG